jgi:hypothetical protein
VLRRAPGGVVIAVPVAVATAVALLACGGCAASAPAAWRGSALSVVRRAADRTIAAGSARVAVTLAENTAGTGVSGMGEVDFGAGRAAFEVGRTGAAAARDERFSVVVDRGVEYVELTSGRGGGGLPGTSPGSPWLAGSPAAVARAGTVQMTPLDTLLVRPGAATAVAFLRGAVDALAYGGQEVEGINTFRYSVHIDLALASRSSPPDQRPALDAAAAAIGSVQWPVDVWVDEQGRVVRLELAEDPELHTTTTRGNLFITDDGNPLALTDLIFTDFGVPAKITVPSPDQVVEAQ